MPSNLSGDLAGQLIYERVAARDQVVNISRRIIRNQLRIARDPAAVARVMTLMAELELAARALVELVDDSPERTWPPGWKITPDVKP